MLFFLYQTTDPSRGWTPVTGRWQSLDDAEAMMAAALHASPTTQVGAYVWDGAAMSWKFF